MTVKNTSSPPPAYRVFISSTYEDMKEYRDAASEALTNVEAVPMGMERFTASTQPVIDKCFEELRQCQFCVCLLGFRYGSLYKDSGLSYSELEFNEAERLGIPTLVFIRSGSISSDKIDISDLSRLDKYKKKLQSSASNRLTANFTTPEDLRDKLTRALQDEFKRKKDQNATSDDNNPAGNTTSKSQPHEDYLDGAAIYKNFIRIPGEYCNQTVRLRVRVDGPYGSWRLKEELFDAYNLPLGKALYLNDIFVLGADYSDIGDEAKHIDMFAVGEAAKWILTNGITVGSVFEGDFQLEWKFVKNVAGKARIQVGASSAYIAKLILRNANLKLIAQSENTVVSTDVHPEALDQENLLNFLQKLM